MNSEPISARVVHPWVRFAILTGALLMGLGALKAILRGANLFSQEISDDLSLIIGGAALVLIIPALTLGLILMLRAVQQRNVEVTQAKNRV